MSLVVFENVSLSLGAKTIVSDLSLRIAEGDRIGLIGPNGSGKTTLLRMSVGQQEPDGGAVRRRSGVRIGYLPQDVVVSWEGTLLEYVRQSVPGRLPLEQELSQLEKEIEEGSNSLPEEELLEMATRIGHLHESLDHFETHFSEHEAKRILAGLGFLQTDVERRLAEFSGGWKMRAVLAGLLFQRPDLLLLDEPTNHLDMPSVTWFAEFLRRTDGAFVLISHDREFLNEQIRRVVSFEPEGVRTYPGDYEQYVRQREEEAELLANQARNVEKQREQIQEFVDRFRAKATKAAQVQSRLRALEKLGPVQLHQARREVRFRFRATERPGREVLKLDNLCHAYGSHVVIDHVNLQVQRGERIGIIGPNGAGKTTLLRLIAGEIPLQTGVIQQGHKVHLGYYAQHHADILRPDATIYQEVARAEEKAGVQQIRAVLGALLFGDDDIEKPIRVLSGGERARVALARLLADPGNVLLMDEPTNHLDLSTSEKLAEALATYDGTLLFVSHNRSFLRRLATRVWHVENREVVVYPGTFEDYMDSRRALFSEEHGGAGKKEKASKQPARDKRDEGASRKERSRDEARLKKEADKLEAEIAALEMEQKKLNDEISSPQAASQGASYRERLNLLQVVTDELNQATARWMEIQETLENKGT